VNLEKDSGVVLTDLPEIYAFISKADVAAAERVLDAADQTFQDITQQPQSGVVYRAKPTDVPELRMIPVNGFPKYLVFYTVGPGVVRILYVLHSARNIPQLFAEDRRS
jgi:plasmid stabilization system protein ParE